MSAPNGIVWGPESTTGGYPGRLGVYTKVTTTNTQASVNVQVWFWTKDSCVDTSNTFYYDVRGVSTGITEATTSYGAVNIDHPSNTDWSTSNQTKIRDVTYTLDRTVNDYVYNVCAKLTDVEFGGRTTSIKTQFTVPKLPSYSITYNANGGTGAPPAQKKYYGRNATLSNSKPARTGYSFLGWATSSSGAVAYQPGSTYTANAAITLYAKWQQNTFTVKFDTNGGAWEDGEDPGTLTKTYGTTLNLPDEVPRNEYHNFLGWAISPGSTEVKYSAGGAFTENVSMTLYAVWELAYIKPQIFNAKAVRCTEDGVITDEGKYALVTFDWECYSDDRYAYEVMEILVAWQKSNTWISRTVDATGLSGSVEVILGKLITDETTINGAFDSDETYSIAIEIYDETGGYSSIQVSIPSQRFPIDVLKGGTGVSFGCPATDEGVAKFAYSLLLNRGDGVYKTLIDLIHPLGSVITLYPNPEDLIEVVSNGKTHYKLTEACAIHPNNVYPGTTWERIAETFLWACDEAGGIGVAGGSPTKTLTVANLPAHSHNIPVAIETTGAITLATSKNLYRNQKQTTSYEGSLSTAETGSSAELNIMPPYVQVAMFRRVE